ncbi:unnamed protein product [Arctogadus glacialis]
MLFSVFVFSFSPPLSLFFVSSPEDSSVSYLMVPKPLDGLSLLRVKGKGLKHKVFHASCEWYGSCLEILRGESPALGEVGGDSPSPMSPRTSKSRMSMKLRRSSGSANKT